MILKHYSNVTDTFLCHTVEEMLKEISNYQEELSRVSPVTRNNKIQSACSLICVLNR